jgi:transcriptional regulator with XRE-family HTH domain
MAARDNADLAERIAASRSTSGLSQKELADKLSVSQPLISQFETGKAKPDARLLEKLEAVLGGITGEGVADQALPALSVWLARVMSKKNLTANELARRAALSVPTIYNLLNGKAENPQQRTLSAIEKVLGETFDKMPPSVLPPSGEEAEGATVQIGELIDFNPYDPKDLPAKPGVYVFYDISGRPIYVGESGNITRRLQDHEDKFWVRPPIVQTAAYVEIPDQTIRRQVETVLIQFLKNNAVLNKKKTARGDGSN